MRQWGIAAGSLAAILCFSWTAAEPQAVKWTVLFGLAAVSLYAWSGVNRIGLICLLLLAWAALSTSWSADWRAGTMGLVYATALLLIGTAASSLDRDAIAKAAPWVGLMGLAGILSLWLVLRGPQDYAGFGNRNFATEAAVMLLPFALLWWRKAKWLACFAVLFCLGILFLNFGAMKWMFLVGVAVAVAVYFWRVTDFLFPFIGFAALLTLSVVKIPEANWSSLLARAEFAINGLYMWAERPWGWGLGALNATYPDFAERHVAWVGDRTIFPNAGHYIGQIHNEYVQLGVELGIVGWALAVWLAVELFRHWWGKKKDGLDWAAAWCLGIGLIIALFAFPFQNPATVFMAAASVGLIACRHPTHRPLPKVLCRPVAVIGSLALLAVAGGIYRADAYYGSAIRAVLANDLVAAVGNTVAAINANPFAREPRHQLAILVTGLYRRGVDIDPAAADRAYAVSRSAGGNDTGIALSRLEYLLNSQRGQERREEVLAIADGLKRHRLLPETKYAIEAAEKVR